MNIANTTPLPSASLLVPANKKRYACEGTKPDTLADIYEEEVNIVIWKRQLSNNLKTIATNFLTANPNYQITATIKSKTISSDIKQALGKTMPSEISDDIAELVDMFCLLFDLSRAGLRLTALNKAMCPKFHVDQVPCRLITTYHGIATQWLPSQNTNRKKLGTGSNEKPDEKSGLFQNAHDIRQLNSGDVALLKGESWQDDEGGGLIHRSPSIQQNESRLLLTLDFAI